MKQHMRRSVVAAALIVGVAVGHGLAATSAGAEPVTPSDLQSLAETITDGLRPSPDGRQPEAIVDSGGSSGSGSGGSSGSAAGSSSGYGHSTAAVPVGQGPELTAPLAAFAYGLASPDIAPGGANRWDCRPSAEHPNPVVLLHGTWLNAFDTFSYLSPQLARAGFCVFALNFGRSGLLEGGGLGAVLPGRYGVGPMEESSRQVADFIERVRTTTGAAKVDIVGHSQGGTIANHYLKFEGGAGKVEKVVTYGATHHGTTLMGIATLGRAINNLGIDILGFNEPIVGISNIQQAVGSPFYATLNAAGDTVPGVDYTAVASRYDEVTNPYDWTFLRAGDGATVRNITLQEGCEQDLSDHLTLMYSPRAASIALNALDPVNHPALNCTFNPWLIGGGGKL
ncbi:esterase/lipase family protein [Nocardia sp. IBHARD005]|uniref:esterase/lipase family protein n=1 Tax=Nocardia sp. IBHARD005 TaxID=3457765 RepID=UPI00405885B0